MKCNSLVPSASSAQPLGGRWFPHARTALAVLQYHSWVRTLYADEETHTVSICLRDGKTLLCNCSVNTFLWCSFICSSNKTFIFWFLISLFPMAFPSSLSPLVAVVMGVPLGFPSGKDLIEALGSYYLSIGPRPLSQEGTESRDPARLDPSHGEPPS